MGDVDTGENDLSLTITLTDPTAGTLAGGGFTETGPGTGIYTAHRSDRHPGQHGTRQRHLHAGTNNSGPSGTFNTDISVTDQRPGRRAASRACWRPTTVTITRVNDDPSGAGSLTTTSHQRQRGCDEPLFAGLTVGDVDTGENDLSLTITLTDPTAGTLSGGGFTETGPEHRRLHLYGHDRRPRPTRHSTTSPSRPPDNSGPSGTFNTDISVTVNDQGGGGEQSVLSSDHR